MQLACGPGRASCLCAATGGCRPSRPSRAFRSARSLAEAHGRSGGPPAELRAKGSSEPQQCFLALPSAEMLVSALESWASGGYRPLRPGSSGWKHIVRSPCTPYRCFRVHPPACSSLREHPTRHLGHCTKCWCDGLSVPWSPTTSPFREEKSTLHLAALSPSGVTSRTAGNLRG